MTFYPNAPDAPDNISTSQGQLQSNNKWLGLTAGNVTPGYYKLPNGLIMQWGSVLVTAPGNIQPSYATPFLTKVYSLTFSLAFQSSANSLLFGSAVCVDNNGLLSLTQAKFRCASTPPNLDLPMLYYLAIGV